MADKEYIEREAIQKRLNRIVEVNNLRTDLAWFTPYGVKALIEEIPAADVRPVVKARWVYTDMSRLVCSNCRNPAAFALKDDGWHHGDFCPNCGARMEES